MENGDVGKLNAENIANLQKEVNDRQQHIYELVMDVKKANGNGKNGWGQVITTLGSFVIIIGFVFTLLQGQIINISHKLEKHIEISATVSETNRIQDEILRIRAWKDEMEKDFPARNAKQDAEIKALFDCMGVE